MMRYGSAFDTASGLRPEHGQHYCRRGSLAKTGAERAINKLVLISVAGRAYDALNGALPS